MSVRGRVLAFGRAGRLRDDRGMTLVEMAVVVMIMGIVMTAIIAGFASFQRDAASSEIRLQNLEEARILMATTTKDLRTATRLSASIAPFVLTCGPCSTVIASDREISFYANIDTTLAPQLVHIYVDPTSELIETTTPADAGSVSPNYTYTPSKAKVRFVGRYVGNVPLTQPIFTFYDAAGAKIVPSPAGGQLTSAQGLAVVSIGVTFVIKKANQLAAPATTLINQVYLPNIYYNPLPTP